MNKIRKQRRENFQKMEQSIIVAVLRHISDHGYQGLTIRGIAKECGVALPVLYRHFESKEAMLEAALMHMAASMREALNTNLGVIDSKWGAWGKLTRYGLNYIEFALTNSYVFKHIFSLGFAYDDDNSRYEENRRGVLWAIVSELKHLVAECIREKALTGDSDVVSYMLWTQVNGISHLLLDAQVSNAYLLAEELLNSFIVFGETISKTPKSQAAVNDKIRLWLMDEIQKILNTHFSQSTHKNTGGTR